MSTTVALIWGLFAALFFYLGYVRWRASSDVVRPFKVRGLNEGEKKEIGEADLGEFFEDFNSYVQGINDKNKKDNLSASAGFFVAGFASLISMILFVYQ